MIATKFRVRNDHYSTQVPYQFQINRFINNRAVDDPITRVVADQLAVDDCGGARWAAIAALRASECEKMRQKQGF